MSDAEQILIVLRLPPKSLSPNRPPASRGGRMAKARDAKRYRRSAWAHGCQQRPAEPWERATVRATFYHATRRRRDDVNHLAMLKPAYDGLVDAGVLVDDDAEHLTTLPAAFEVDRERPRVELLITRVAEGPTGREGSL